LHAQTNGPRRFRISVPCAMALHHAISAFPGRGFRLA